MAPVINLWRGERRAIGHKKEKRTAPSLQVVGALLALGFMTLIA